MTETDYTVMESCAADDDGCPSCREILCFGNNEGICTVLYDTDFGTGKCPFFKTRDEAASQQLDALQRLVDQGRFDLIGKYRKTLEEMGILTYEDPFFDEYKEEISNLKELSELEKKLMDEIRNYAVDEDAGEVSEWDDTALEETGDV